MSLIALLLMVPLVALVLYLLWFLFLTERDLTLALAERFGRSVSVYREKVIWVTGASTGLGEALAYELASVGAKLILSARNENLLVQVKNKCLELAKGKLDDRDILVLPFDITHLDVHKTKADQALDHFGQIDVLISNAARIQFGLTVKTDTEVDKDLFDVNVFGGINLTKLILKHFLERGKGQMIVISSLAGKIAVPRLASYSATKHALHAYYDALRAENVHNHVHVTLVCPGNFESEILTNAMSTTKGQKFQIKNHFDAMTAARCAHLTLVAAANKLYEVWFSYQPFLFYTWLAHYAPDLFKRAVLSKTPKRATATAAEGREPHRIFSWKPLF